MIDREKIKKGLECLARKQEPIANPCSKCDYHDRPNFAFCIVDIATDTLALLKEQNWVKCSDRMPEERETIFAKLKGTDRWNGAMFEKASDDVRVVQVFSDGSRRVYHDNTVDGKWYCESRSPLQKNVKVTHWMPNPELPNEGR